MVKRRAFLTSTAVGSLAKPLRVVAWITVVVVATTCSEGVGTAGSARRFRGMATEFYFTPELHLKDGRIRRFDRGSTSETKSCTKWNALSAKKTLMLQHASFLRWLEELEVLE